MLVPHMFNHCLLVDVVLHVSKSVDCWILVLASWFGMAATVVKVCAEGQLEGTYRVWQQRPPKKVVLFLA